LVQRSTFQILNFQLEKRTMRTQRFMTALLTLTALQLNVAHAGQKADDPSMGRGKYLVRIGGCNDCHTPGYPESSGKIPEKEWLQGNGVGFQGPWGTTYPANLRMTVSKMSEDQWLTYARREVRPPMPWFALRDMSDADLRTVYRFINALGPRGRDAPSYVPPGGVVTTPYVDMMPRNLPTHQSAR
jgi:mono/diheme cytochrome c family protein